MIERAAETGLVSVGKVIDGWRAGTADSYVDYTRPARVEPILLVDSSILFNENTSTVVHSLHSAFSAYYLLAWNMMMVTIDNVAVARHLDKLNPNRSVKDSILDGAGAIFMMSQESYQPHRLPRFGKASNEARQIDHLFENEIQEAGGLTKNSTKIIHEQVDLSVGKLLEVEISNGKNKTSLPIMVRLMANTMVPNLLADLLSTGHADNSVSSRIMKWRTGEIGIMDLLTAKDLVKQHKARLLSDNTGMYNKLVSQRRGNTLSGLVSLNPSVANSSNLVICSTETIRKVELAINEKFDNHKVRQRLFDATGLFIVAVMDVEYERVRFYTTGIPHVSDLSIRECKASNKNESASITDILKAYQLGNAPSF